MKPIKSNNINTLHRTKPHLYKIGGKWDYKPCLGHELNCYAHNYLAAEYCHRVSKNDRIRNHRAKHISTFATSDTASA